jgi:hypothetical protein
MPKVVLLVLLSLVMAPADALPFLVEGEADAGTAVGVVDCADMVEMVSIAKELLATLLLQEGVLSSTSVKLYWPECYRILSPCALGFVIVVLIVEVWMTNPIKEVTCNGSEDNYVIEGRRTRRRTSWKTKGSNDDGRLGNERGNHICTLRI